MNTKPLTIEQSAAFHEQQGPVPIREAMIAWDEESKALAVVRHPDVAGMVDKLV
jgi:hypothetical protein